MSKKNTLAKFTAVTAFLGGICAFGNHFYRLSSIPHNHTKSKDHDPKITEGRYFVRKHERREHVYINSIDKLWLHANFIPSEKSSHNYVILIHGIWDSSDSNGIYAEHYLEKGFNCLLPDLRGFGQSEGKYIGYGFHDRLDIMEWIDWIIKRDNDAKIIIHGMSMGAATTLMTTGEHLPDNVKGAISDSAYSTLKEQFSSIYHNYKGSILPVPIAMSLMRIIISIRSGFDINDVSCVDAVSRSQTPTLFIHGDNDTFISPHMCSVLYEAANCPKQYMMILGAKHIEGVIVDPKMYWDKIDSFVSKLVE